MCAGGSEEAMVVAEERWGDDQEVGMDVDLTEEEERQLLSEISYTRGNVQLLSLPSSFPLSSHNLPSCSDTASLHINIGYVYVHVKSNTEHNI